MTATITTNYSDYTLIHSVLEGNMFSGSDTEGIDTRASVYNYIEMVTEKMQAEYPGLKIEIEPQFNTEGCNGSARVYSPDGNQETEDEIQRSYEFASEKIYQSWDWVVNNA